MSHLYEIVTARYGTRTTRRADVFLNNSIYGDADGPIEMDYFFWVARNEARTVVIDTGFSLVGGSSRGRTTLAAPPRLFDALDVDPTSEPTVIVTHAHYDHLGNLDHFPGSQVVIAASELEFWTSDYRRRAQFHHSIEESEIALLAEAREKGRVDTFDGRCEVAPGIEVIEIGGHTPGQSVVKVDTSEGVVLLASDAIHYYEEYERDMPFVFLSSLLDTYIGFDRIRAMAESGEVRHIVPGHDPATLDRLRGLPGARSPLAGTEFEDLAVSFGTAGETDGTAKPFAGAR